MEQGCTLDPCMFAHSVPCVSVYTRRIPLPDLGMTKVMRVWNDTTRNEIDYSDELDRSTPDETFRNFVIE